MKSSTLKRLITMTLCFLVLISSLSTVAFAAVDSRVTFACDFNEIEDGTVHGSNNEMGWNSFNNSNLGVVASDYENGPYLNMRNAGFRNFNVASETKDSGKIYVGFSYKYELPQGAIDGSGINIYAQSETGTSCLKIRSDQYSDIEGGLTKTEQRNQNNFYIGIISGTLGIKNDTSSSTKGETVGVNISDGSWHEIGYIFDLDNKTLKAVVDNTFSKELSFPSEYIGTLGTIGFQTSEGKYYGSFDNFVVKHFTTENKMSAKAVKDEEQGTIDITFDEPVASKVIQSLTDDGVNLVLCGSSDSIAIDSVEKVNGIIRLTYSGELLPGKEYLLEFPKGLKSIFGTELPDNIFVSADPKVEETIDEGQVVIPTHDFETDEELNSDWYNAGGKHVIAEIPEDYKRDNTSTYAMSAKGWSLKFGDNTTMAKENLKGIMRLEFDYYHTNKDGLLLIFSQAASGGYRNAFPVCSTAWKHMKIEIDYGKNEIRSWVDNGAVRTDNADNRSLFPESLAEANYQRLWIEGTNLTTSNFYIDNFSQVYEYEYSISYPYVRSVRYIDVDDNELGANSVTSAVKKINITFSEDMDDVSLGNIYLTPNAVTDTAYDEDTYTYTLFCDGLLDGDTAYTLTIPETVTSKSFNPVEETQYCFHTTDGLFYLRNTSFNINGEEITSDDVPNLAGCSVDVSTEVINTADISGLLTIVYALYKADAMVDINYSVVGIPLGFETLSTDTFTVREGINPDSLKVFVWKGKFKNMTPMTDPIEY